MQIKKTLIYIAAAGIFLTPFQASALFSDLDIDHPQYEAIMSLYEKGIVKGYDDGTFKPDAAATKAEFYKMLFNHVGYKPAEGFYEVPFTDVGSGYWFAPYVMKALELDLLKFNPEVPIFLGANPVQRIEALQLLVPLEGIPTPYTEDKTTIFEDIEPGYTYLRLVKAAENSGIFIAEEQPYFFPVRILTRGDIAELLYKAEIYRENLPGGMLPLIDISLDDYVTSFDPYELELMNNPKFPIFLNVWQKINEQYLYLNDIDPDNLVYGAISGMVTSLEDPYSTFEKPDIAENLWDTLEGNYEGIGTIIDTFEDEYIVIGIINGSPADEAGLKTGDVIKSIDGKTFGTDQINELIDAIKGPTGTSVKIEIQREGQILVFDITRQEITLDTVLLESSNTEVPASLGYIAIYQFTDSTPNEFDAILTETLADDPKGLIIDLRDNPGGYVDAALEILGYFIPEGETIAKLQISGEYISEKSDGPGLLNDMPAVILVNENTASAAEIVAAALQEKDIATLVGETTYGKGTVQEVNIYTDGSLLKLSIAKWLTPDGNDIDHKGLTPDIYVETTKEDVLGETDSQLQRAIDELNKVI